MTLRLKRKIKICAWRYWKVKTAPLTGMRYSLKRTHKWELSTQNWSMNQSSKIGQNQGSFCLIKSSFVLWASIQTKKWEMSPTRRENMKLDLRKALDEKESSYKLNLGFHMKFDRKNPPGSKHDAYINQLKALNTTLYHDCQTKQ
jgi:hypothetical protein